jgi:membrane protease YdiL (CAAX protease family)
MSGTDPRPNLEIHGLCRFRYLLDILILIGAVWGLEICFSAAYSPKSMPAALTADMGVQMIQVAVAWLLIRLRGETLAAIGLKQPNSWGRTFIIGILIASFIFVGMYLLERMGFRRDLSRFNTVQGNLELTIYGVFYALIGAGFYEEFMFRGFLMQGVAMLCLYCPRRRLRRFAFLSKSTRRID